MSEIRDKMSELLEYMNSKIIGQEDLNRKLLITLLADGHALVEGAPGLAKTKAIKTLSSLISAPLQPYSVYAGFAAVRYCRKRYLRGVKRRV